MLAKKMQYWADGEMVREKYAAIDHRTTKGLTDGMKYDGKGGDLSRNDLDKDWKGQPHTGRNPRSVVSAPEQLVTLRQDLSEEDRNHVLERLAQNGLL